MNERIQELFEQAANRDFPTLISSIHPNELERFVELIIKECMMICGAIQGAGEVRGMSDFASGASQCRAIIKRDFGVEE